MPSGHEPQPSRPPWWKKYLLPAAAAGALLLVVVIIAIVATGGEDGDEENDDGELSTADIATATAEAEAAMTELTPTPDPSDELVPMTPEPSPTSEEDAGPTPTPTAVQVAEEPAPTPTPVADDPPPADPPVTGDFGELPAGDMPSGSPADALNLQFNLNLDLQSLPGQAAAYQINRRQWTLEDAQSVVSSLAIDADVVDQGGGSFQAEGSTASIYINPASIQYVRTSSPDEDVTLPGNEQLIQTARNWLTENGLVAGNLGSGEVRNRNEQSGIANVLLSPAEPSNIISGTPSARVSVRGDGIVTEATISWFQSLTGSTYGLRPAEDLWADAISGRGFIDINANDLPSGFQGASATANITSAWVAYTIAGSPQGTQYLVPVMVFSGTANVEGTSAPVNIYVQAAAAQAVPRG